MSGKPDLNEADRRRTLPGTSSQVSGVRLTLHVYESRVLRYFRNTSE